MTLSRTARRAAALAAAFGIALQALWPLVAQARPAGIALKVPFCGMEAAGHAIEIKFGMSTPLDERTASHGEHCKLCLLGDGQAVLAVGVPDVFSPRGESHPVLKPASLFTEPSRHLTARPRAPPQVS